VRFTRETWETPPARTTLERDEVHIWRARLDAGGGGLGHLYELLSADERRRAERFHFRRDREHFVTARGALRRLLGAYLSAEPARLRFNYNPFGKPSLAGAEGDENALRFNLSHSGGVALYAFAWGREVGVDVEHMRQDVAELVVADSFLSGAEISILSPLPADLQAAAFFNCWTRKEAFIKAVGEGFSFPLTQFTTPSILEDSPPAVLVEDPRDGGLWTLKALHPGADCAGALVVEGSVETFRCWQWRS
jgi:4'-phosphopantetheinyl transferase